MVPEPIAGTAGDTPPRATHSPRSSNCAKFALPKPPFGEICAVRVTPGCEPAPHSEISNVRTDVRKGSDRTSPISVQATRSRRDISRPW